MMFIQTTKEKEVLCRGLRAQDTGVWRNSDGEVADLAEGRISCDWYLAQENPRDPPPCLGPVLVRSLS